MFAKLAMLFLLTQAPGDKFKGQESYDVVRVVDGDTVVLSIDNKPITVRLIGVDTPETVNPKKPVQFFGKEASAYLRKLLTGKKVFIEREPGPSDKDKYGRDLAYLYTDDGLLVNKEIIKQGYGFAYVKYPFSKMEDFRKAQTEAREAEAGLWNPNVKHEVRVRAPSNYIVYVTPKGKSYHEESCKFNTSKSERLTLGSAARNRKACKVCHPPELDKELDKFEKAPEPIVPLDIDQ